MADRRLTSWDNVTSNTAKVSDLDAVYAVLREYETDCDILSRRDEDGRGGVIRIHGEETWPRAVKRDELPPPNDTNDGDDAWLEVMFDKGDQGFLDLLLALAPHLTVPLVVQAVMLDGVDFLGAKEWILRPGAKEVETKAIDTISDDTDDVGFQLDQEFSEVATREAVANR